MTQVAVGQAVIDAADTDSGEDVIAEDPPGWTQRMNAGLRNPHVRFGQWVATGALLVLTFVEVLYPAPIGVLVLGGIDGAILGMLAMGIVLIYRANRIINFAQGDLGAVGGLLGILLIVGPGVPFFVSMAIGLFAALVLGAVTELAFVRRFGRHPRLILTVATLGIAQIFQAGEIVLPKAFGRDLAPQIESTPLDFVQFRIRPSDPILFGGSHVLAVLVVGLAAVGLGAFFRLTRVGIAVRGAAESSERVAQLGVPTKRINTLVWVIAAGLSALAMFVQAPIGGVPLGQVLGPALLLPALAAAVIGRMESMPVTFGAAVLLGVLRHACQYATGRATLGNAIVFAVIIAAFLVRPHSHSTRADDAGPASWSLIREIRPVPVEVARMPEVRIGIAALRGLVFAVLIVAPLMLQPTRVNLLFEQAVIFALIGISLVILTGWGGEISLGQIAFFALGAATAGKLATLHWDFFLCVLAAGFVGAAAALIVGVPALRIRGPFLAVATLGLALTTSSFFLDPQYFPWFVINAQDVVERPVLFGRFDLHSEHAFYYLLLTVLSLVLMSVRSFRNSRAGRVLIASRDNARAAQAYGISIVRARLWAFSMSGFIAALAGGLFVFQQEGLSRNAFSPERGLVVFTIVVVGGLGSVTGAMLGAAYYTTVSYAVHSPFAFVFVQGIGLLVILLVLPGGFGGALYDTRDAILRWVARRRSIDVPDRVGKAASDRAPSAVLVEDPFTAPDDVTRTSGAASRSRRWLEQKLSRVTGGAPPLPVLVLFGVYFFDEFDTAAFGVLAPKIRAAFDLSVQEFGLVVAANLVIVLAAAVPLGYFGDRMPRRAIVVAGALVAGAFSFLTGLAPTILILLVARIGNGFGVTVNDPIHRSLLSDYYAPATRPTVFAFHGNAVRYGSILGAAVAGITAEIFGWRVAFMILVVPVTIMGLAATRLPHVARGQSDDLEAAVAAAEAPPVPFDRAVRMLWTVATLRRQYYAWIFIGAGFLPLGIYFPEYLDHVFQLSTGAVGVIVAVGSAIGIVGVELSGRLTRGWLARDVGTPLLGAGLALMLVGPCLLVIALAPNVAVGVIGILGVFFLGGVFAPPFLTVQSVVSPARVRALSFSFGSVFLAGGFTAFIILLGHLANGSIRVGLAALAPCWVIGGVILASGRSTVDIDARRALSILTTTAQLRDARLTARERALVVARAVDVAYGQTQVLFGVDLEVREGEIVALLGTNGAGKSTLLKAIAGSIEASGGAIFYDGADITGLGAPAAAAAGIALVPGGKGVLAALTVAENLRLASWLLDDDEVAARAELRQSLVRFPILHERRGEKAGNLSGGEQQMLALAMALLSRPKLLMIDELSLGLAPVVVAELLEIVRDINRSGVTVILVEQSVNVALTVADRAVFMEKGEIRLDGPTTDLLERPDVLRSVFLEGAAAAVGASEGGPVDGDSIASSFRFEVPVDRKGRTRPPMLIVRDISVRFGGIRAVSGVDLDLYEGQIVGLIGPNGAGKTTVFDIISGFVATDSGSVSLSGYEVTHLAPDARARLGLGRSFQDARLFPSMTVRETLAVARERHVQLRDPLAAALCSPATRMSEREVTAHVDWLIELMRIGAFANTFVHELSTGSRRIVDLACVLAHEPRILLLDEPSSGIAQRETEALGPLLLDIRDEIDVGMLVIEHDMPLITSISDAIVALELGAVIASGEPRGVMNDPRVVAAYLGTTAEVINRSGDYHQLGDAHNGHAILREAGGTRCAVDTAPSLRRRSAPLRADRAGHDEKGSQ